jgi:hypothetical protein
VIADELIDFARLDKWSSELINYAEAYSQQVEMDWVEFSKGVDRLL